jgi:hypothetical protein
MPFSDPICAAPSGASLVRNFPFRRARSEIISGAASGFIAKANIVNASFGTRTSALICRAKDKRPSNVCDSSSVPIAAAPCGGS